MIINIIEGILLSLFITSIVEIPKKKLLCQVLTALTSFTIIQISNYISMYDLFLTSIVILAVTMVVSRFSTDTFVKVLFATCLESVLYSYAGFIGLLTLDYIPFARIDILAKVIYIILMIPLLHLLKKRNLYISDKTYLVLAFILFTLQIECTFLIQLYFILGHDVPEIKKISFIFLIGQAIFLYVIFHISHLYQIKHDYEKLEMEKENYDTLIPLYEEIKIMKHDLKHDYNMYIHYIKQNKIDELLDHIHKNKDEIDDNMNLIHTPDDLLNIIINNKIIHAYKKHIQIMTHIQISNTIKIDQYDLTTLLSNMIDNAIENSSGSIMIKIIEDGPYLHISIQNSFAGTFTTTTKKDKKYHGVGLKSIENICKKYCSSLNISINHDNVIMETSLYLK